MVHELLDQVNGAQHKEVLVGFRGLGKVAPTGEDVGHRTRVRCLVPMIGPGGKVVSGLNADTNIKWSSPHRVQPRAVDCATGLGPSWGSMLHSP